MKSMFEVLYRFCEGRRVCQRKRKSRIIEKAMKLTLSLFLKNTKAKDQCKICKKKVGIVMGFVLCDSVFA